MPTLLQTLLLDEALLVVFRGRSEQTRGPDFGVEKGVVKPSDAADETEDGG